MNIILPKLNVGDTVKAYDLNVKVSITVSENDCNECEIHDKCNRDYFHLRDLCNKHNAKSCGELIGIGKHFEIV